MIYGKLGLAYDMPINQLMVLTVEAVHEAMEETVARARREMVQRF